MGLFLFSASARPFPPNSLWQDLSPVDWLLRKMGENLHMQNATWLISRELAEAAGPWDVRLGVITTANIIAERSRYRKELVSYLKAEYFTGHASNRVSYIGNSDKKKNSLALSMKMHIRYLLSLEESERVRKACLTYIQNWYENFYPERPDIVTVLQAWQHNCRVTWSRPTCAGNMPG